MTSEEIDALVARAAAGDRAAFRTLVLELEMDLRFHLAALEVSEGLADEVLQATFVSAYQNLGQYRGAGAFRGWLKAIARNHMLRALRDQQRFCAANADTLEGALVGKGLEDLERMEELEHQSRRLRTVHRAAARGAAQPGGRAATWRGCRPGAWPSASRARRSGCGSPCAGCGDSLRRCIEGPAA